MMILGRHKTEKRIEPMKKNHLEKLKTIIVMIALLAVVGSIELAGPFRNHWKSLIKRCVLTGRETLFGKSEDYAERDLIDETTELDARIAHGRFDIDFCKDVGILHARALSAIESRSRSGLIRVKEEMTALWDRIDEKTLNLAEEAESALDKGLVDEAEPIVERCVRLGGDVDLIHHLKYRFYITSLKKTRSLIESIEHKLESFKNRRAQTSIDSTTSREIERLKSELRSYYVGISMVRIEPGAFRMGSNDDDKNEKPVHEVRITRAFEMSSCEITQKQYEQIVGDNPSWFSSSGSGKSKVHEETSNHPVENLTFYHAILFCNKLSERVGYHPYYISDGKRLTIHEGNGFRLPTEAEWEYACRAGSDQTFFFGDDEKDLDSYAWFKLNSNGKPHPVGQKKPNAWGLYDMAGNVIEFCFDYYDPYYYQSSPREDPLNTKPDRYHTRVYRGANWGSDPGDLRSSRRYMGVDWNKSIATGIRLARTP